MELAKKSLEMIKESKDAVEKYERGEISSKEMRTILQKNEEFTIKSDKLIADLEEHMNKIPDKDN